MSVSTISDNIKNSLEILTQGRGISEADLCREINISQATLWRLFHGTTDPRASTLNTIASYFNVTVDQLIGNQPIARNVQQCRDSIKPISIPIFSLGAPSTLTEQLRGINPGNWNQWLEVEPSINESCFAVVVLGESMWPLFLEGIIIIIDPGIVPKNKHYVLCQLHNTQEIIFRQYLEDHGEKLLKPANFGYQTTALQEQDQILGVVIQSKNKLID